METEKHRVISFLHSRTSQETFEEYSQYFKNSDREDLIRSLSTRIWDCSHGDADSFLELMTDLKKDLPEYFVEAMQGAMTGKHDT